MCARAGGGRDRNRWGSGKRFAPELRVTRLLIALPILIATYMPFCTPAIKPTAPPAMAAREMAQLWHDPGDVAAADVVWGPWGREHAPDPHATYTLKHLKTHGVSPGMTIADPAGHKWSVKQGPEAQVEVVTSRMLSALGYHQPPVYFLATANVRDRDGTRTRPAGRLRPKDDDIKEKGDWSWQQNPFVGTQPYNGLLVLLDLVNSTDLKNSNNSIYVLKQPREGAKKWYVVRDIGAGLGETGRMSPRKNDVDLFARDRFIDSVSGGFVAFTYDGFHQELFRDRISTADVHWACNLAARITDAQWRAMFRAVDYDEPTAARFIQTIKKRIEQGRALP